MKPKTHSDLKQLLQEFHRTGRELHAHLGHHVSHHPGTRRFESHLRKAVRGAAGALMDARRPVAGNELFVVRISWMPSESEPARSATLTQPDAAFDIGARSDSEATTGVDEHLSSGETLSSEEERCWQLYERLRAGVENASGASSASSVAPPIDDGWPPVDDFTLPFGNL